MKILSRLGSPKYFEVIATTALVMVTRLLTVPLPVTSPETAVKEVEQAEVEK